MSDASEYHLVTANSAVDGHAWEGKCHAMTGTGRIGGKYCSAVMVECSVCTSSE